MAAKKEIIKVGARKVDVTGLTPAMQQKVIAAAKGGKGSLASRALAKEFQKQVAGKTATKTPADNTNIVTTGGPGVTNQDPVKNMPLPSVGTQQPAGQPEQSVQNAGPRDTAQSNDYYGADRGYDPSAYKEGVKPTTEVKAETPNAIAGSGQYKSADLSLNDGKTGVDKSGAINPDRAAQTIYNTEQTDAQRNFNMNNPGLQVDEFGNRQDVIYDPSSGQTKVIKSAGGPLSGTMNAFQNALGGFTTDLSGQVANAQNANYSYMTRNLDRQKQQELEASKQELAQRGIPIDPSEKSLWSQTTGNINNKYQDLYDQANQQSIMLGNQTLGAQTGAQNSTLGTLTNTAQAFRQNATPYQGGTVDSSGALQGAINTASGANIAVGQTKAEIEKAKIQAEAQKAAAKQQAENNKGPVFNS